MEQQLGNECECEHCSGRNLYGSGNRGEWLSRQFNGEYYGSTGTRGYGERYDDMFRSERDAKSGILSERRSDGLDERSNHANDNGKSKHDDDV